MKKYNLKNYIRYKEDLSRCIPIGKDLKDYTRDEFIVGFMPLCENLARKFSSTEQSIGALTVEDLIQFGAEGLIKAVDKLDYDRVMASENIEKTLQSFFGKRIRGSIRRRIDESRSSMRIPEHKRNSMRKDSDNKKNVEIFFKSIFLSIDEVPTDEDGDSIFFEVADNSEPYNIEILNSYLKGVMKKYLDRKEYEVLRMSYGLDCVSYPAIEIANILGLNGASNFVRVSEIKRQAVDKLILNVDYNQLMNKLN